MTATALSIGAGTICTTALTLGFIRAWAFSAAVTATATALTGILAGDTGLIQNFA